MKLRSLDIGRLTAQNNIIAAPMAGYTDFAFRALLSRLGVGLTVTEMVSCKGLIYNNEHTRDLLYRNEEEGLSAVQIFGSDKDIMRQACESEDLKDFDIVDINMGCPVAKIYNNGEGSRLMEEPEKAEAIVRNCVKSGKIITVKFRAGLKEDRLLAADFAKRMEDAGASLVCIHGRTREGMYSGKIHYDEIAKAKASVKIPVIANGGLFTVEDCDIMLDRTGADGVAIARGGLFNPLLFSELCMTNSKMSLKDCAFYLMDLRLTRLPDVVVAHGMRKFCAQLLKGMRGGKEAKLKIFEAQSTSEIKDILNGIL